MKKLIVLAMLLTTAAFAGMVKYKTSYPLVSLGNGYFGSANNVCIDGESVFHKTKETWKKCVGYESYGRNGDKQRCAEYADLPLVGPVKSTYKLCVKYKRRGKDENVCVQYKTKIKDHSLPKLATITKEWEVRGEPRSTEVGQESYTIAQCN